MTALLLAFTAGYVDTVGFIALLGLFTAHVTGNFVLIGATLVRGGDDVVAKLLALPLFLLSVAATRFSVLALERRGRDPAIWLVLAQALLLLLFMALGLKAAPITDADAPVAIAAGMAGVAAMAVQNAASRTVFALLSPTTVMTGNVTQLVIDLVDRSRGAGNSGAATRWRKLWPPVVSFAIGSAAGALGYVAIGFWSLLVAVTAVLATFVDRRNGTTAP